MRLPKTSAVTTFWLVQPAFAALSVLLAGQAHAASYTLTDIAQGATYSSNCYTPAAIAASAINDSGHVAGQINGPKPPDWAPPRIVFSYSYRRFTCIPANDYNSGPFGAYAINNKGWITGQMGDGHAAFLYNGKTVSQISGNFTEGDAINNAGTVVGSWDNDYAFKYQKGRFTSLATLGLSTATGINDRGEIVGETTDGFGYIYNGITVNKFAKGAEPAAINIFGEVAGYFTAADKSIHAFIWNGTMHDLGPGVAVALNEAGEVVGSGGNPTTALLWDQTGAHDLNTLVPAGSPHLAAAVGINIKGQILANSCADDHEGVTCSAFILTPTDAKIAER